MGSIKGQLEQIEGINREAFETRSMSTAVDQAVQQYKGKPVTGEVEYRSGGEYILDIWNAHNGNREAGDRLETYYRAAAHQKTSDNLGLIPDPVVGEVINFIDAARPLVSTLGPRPLTSATFHRPRVTQHTAVGKQGAAGGKTDEKSELTSQKMVIDRLTAEAVTYGGYVNVSRQNIDFSTPAALDLIVNDLAAQYAIETEAATCDLLATTATTAVNYDETPSAGDLHRGPRPGALGARRSAGSPGCLRSPVRPGEPAQRTVGRFQRQQLRTGRHGHHLGRQPGDVGRTVLG
jgi:HK97 family phage major capsid protein